MSDKHIIFGEESVKLTCEHPQNNFQVWKTCEKGVSPTSIETGNIFGLAFLVLSCLLVGAAFWYFLDVVSYKRLCINIVFSLIE